MAINKDDLKPFQINTVKSLSETFIKLWNNNENKLKIFFKAPTGSGKTTMMAEFIRSLDSAYNFDEDKCYIWISFGDDTSYMQSKNKFIEYFGSEEGFSFKDKNDLNEDKLLKNNVFFINWSSIKASDTSGRVLRRDTEQCDNDLGIFDNYILNTKEEREIVLIIDEAHAETDTELADEILDLIDPRIIICVTATPKENVSPSDILRGKIGWVEAFEDNVIDSGLIKQKLITQTKEDIERVICDDENLSIDQALLRLAHNKRNEIKDLYNKVDEELRVNPLVLIQLPNDYKESEDTGVNYKEMVLNELKSIGVNIEEEVAIWLDKEKTVDKLKTITEPNDDTNYLIFKVAPAKGWDCPRACILVMYREIKSPTFRTQILGRIKRMPFGKLTKIDEINKGYIFTNYTKQDIKDVCEVNNKNNPDIYYSKLKENIDQIVLPGYVKLRTGFNTITPPTKWQQIFFHNADVFFGIDDNKSNSLLAIKKKIDLDDIEITAKILSNAVIDSYDNFIEELKNNSSELDINMSNINVERLYNWLCFEMLKNQKDEDAKYNVARSWRTVKSSITSWFESRTNISDLNTIYRIIVKDLNKPNSIFKNIVYSSLIEFRNFVSNKTEFNVLKKDFVIPQSENSYNDSYELYDTKKCAYDSFYIKSNYDGKKVELSFIGYLESLSSVEWWIKQDDKGSSVFGVKYLQTDVQPPIEAIFNVDFIIKTKKCLYLLDSKDGITAKSINTRDKCRDLQAWIKENSNKFEFDIIGGIIKNIGNNVWLINDSTVYDNANQSQWKQLDIK